MKNTKRKSNKKVICVNADEETLKILSFIKNKSDFIRDAIKDKFLYEKFKEEYIKLKKEIEKLKIENEKLKKTKNAEEGKGNVKEKIENYIKEIGENYIKEKQLPGIYERNEIMIQKIHLKYC